MKTNEAPEKIYINSNLEDRTWLIGKGDTSFIKYTRTDAFIEKACKWLGPVFKDLAGYYSGAELLDDFKKYMKGE